LQYQLQFLCVLIFKIVDILYKEEQCREKYQKTATTLFVLGIIGIIISQAIFNKQNSLNNQSIRFGLLGGSIVIIFYSVIKNWDLLDDITKLIIFSILFCVIIGWTFIASNNIIKIKKKANKKKTEVDLNEEILDEEDNNINNSKQIYNIEDDEDDIDFDN
jgi:uncharacterized membrane protein YeaQ/YmgE (transglycosylase-associated protein family)